MRGCANTFRPNPVAAPRSLHKRLPQAEQIPPLYGTSSALLLPRAVEIEWLVEYARRGNRQIFWIRTTLWGEAAVLPKLGKSMAIVAFRSRIAIDLCSYQQVLVTSISTLSFRLPKPFLQKAP